MRLAGRAALAVATILALSGCLATPKPVDGLPTGGSPGLPGPPTATMVIEGTGFVGEVGSYTLPDRGEDSPWLGAAALDVTVGAGAGDTLAISLADTRIGPWSASYAAAADPSPPRPTALAGSEAEAAAVAIELPAPPPGDWIVMARLDYATGGSGAYYWHVVVTP